ncbi:MAG: hypothetical protein P8J17_17835 [Halioglobus sp.]|nr:hypothetical protein [Halioglobus sp.]
MPLYVLFATWMLLPTCRVFNRVEKWTDGTWDRLHGLWESLQAAIQGKTMTAAKAIEYQITRQLLKRREADEAQRQDYAIWPDRLIAVLAATAILFIVGSYLEELLWVALAAGTVLALGRD